MTRVIKNRSLGTEKEDMLTDLTHPLMKCCRCKTGNDET